MAGSDTYRALSFLSHMKDTGTVVEFWSERGSARQPPQARGQGAWPEEGMLLLLLLGALGDDAEHRVLFTASAR